MNTTPSLHRTRLLFRTCTFSVSLVIFSALPGSCGFFQQSEIALAKDELVTFSDVTQFSNVGSTISQWGAIWNDFDGDDDLDVAMADYMSRGMEESEFAAAEPVSGARNNPAFSNRANISTQTDNFSDAILDYIDDLRQ